MNKLKKYYIYISLLFFILLAIIYSEKHFTNSTVDTSVIITRLKEIRKLEVLQADLFSYKNFQDSSMLGLNNNSFSVIETGKAVYGIDFDKGLNISRKEKSIRIELPPVEIFNVIVNPDSIDFIGVEKGILTGQQRFEELKKEVSTELFNEIRIKANNKENKLQAENSAKTLIYSILKTLGFNDIEIIFKRKVPEN